MIIDEPRISKQIEAVKQVAAFLWEKGWAERNAGNISVNLSGWDVNAPNDQVAGKVVKMALPSESAGMVLFLTGKGKRLRDLPHAPEQQACIVCIADDASYYQYLWGGEPHEYFAPTSEFLSHLAIHLELQRQQSSHRCVLHTHPSALIALSHHPVFGTNETLLNRALWGMLPEVKLFVPRGVGIVPYMQPGSQALASATVKHLLHCNVVLWRKHGALATGTDALEAFDFLDVSDKAAGIYLQCLQAGYTPVGLSDEEIKGLEGII